MASAANQFASNFNLSQFGKATDLKKRLWFTFLALIVFRLLSFVPLPGIDPRTMGALFAQTHGGVLDFFNTFSGGSLSRMSLIALGLMPYITASIVVQLSTSLSPHLEALKKEGESGRKKLNQYTRYGTVLLTAIQGYFIAVGLENWKTPAGLSAVVDPGLLFRISCVISLIGGTMFLMWLGEQITSRGVGNGTSLIIMAGIVSQLPVIILNTLERTRSGAVNPALIIAVIAVVAALVLFICFMERAQRRVLIQYPKRQSANGMMQADKSHLPLKLNTANVIPPIFASSVLLMPLTITQFAGQRVTAGGRWSNILITLNQYLAHGTWLYMLLYGLGIVFFSFFYTAIVFNPEETADNLKKYGGFIPGIRPGKATADYLDYLLTRITVIGAAYLTCICLVPEFMASELGMTSFAIGGTSLLIVVNVTIDTVTQIQSHLIAHQYGDLIRKSKLRGKSIRRRQRLK